LIAAASGLRPYFTSAMNILSLESEPTEKLEAVLKAERAKPDGDPELIKALQHITARRVLGLEDDRGFPRALLDEKDSLPF